LQKQLAAQQADNKELHKKLDQLIATVAQGNHQNAALNSAQLNEQKKNNNILGNPITGVV
jgi:low affinity Fe/Cu permease